MRLLEKILEKENIPYKNIKRSSSGFTNDVYFVDDRIVIKLINKDSNPIKLKREILFYKNANLDFIPKFISSGNIDNNDYLIIEKLKGVSLFKIWHNLSWKERENVTKQIANILKLFHRINFDFLDDAKFDTWAHFWQKTFNLNIEVLNKMGYQTSCLRNFQNKHLDKIFEEEKICLIYNDAHFDNFIYDKGKLKLIDFDRIKICSVDYELLIIKTMLDDPRKFASEEDEKFVNIDDYQYVFNQLKKSYHEMFDFKFLNQRLFVYQFIYRLGQGFEYNNKQMIEFQLKIFEDFCKKL